MKKVQLLVAWIASLAGVMPAAAQRTTMTGSAPPSALTLERVVRDAIERHPLIEAAEARLRGSQGARSTARVLPNPILTYQVENTAFPGGSLPPGIDRETQLFATLPLEPLWQRWSRTRRAGQEVRAAAAELVLARRDVAIDAVRAFHRAALAQISVQAAADIEAGLDSLVQFNQTRVREGVTAEGDLIRIEVERDRAATERSFQEVELVRARAELLPFLSDTLRASLTVASLVVAVDERAIAAAALPDVAELTARALAQRADVTAGRARVQAARAETGFQRTLLVRQLGLSFGAKTTAGVRSMSLGISVPVPIFDQNRGEIQRAASERTAAERELEWTERRATAEVAAAYEAVRILAARASRLEQGFLARAEESRRVALAAYLEGAAPLLQVIDATRTLADARHIYYRAQFAQRQSVFDLYAAIGLDPLSPLAPIARSFRSQP